MAQFAAAGGCAAKKGKYYSQHWTSIDLQDYVQEEIRITQDCKRSNFIIILSMWPNYPVSFWIVPG